MIVHVLRRAQAAGVGPVVVATDSREIAAAVEKAGGRAVMTRADHASGSDRIFEALGKVDPAGTRRDHRQCAGRPADARRRPTSPPRWRRSPTRPSISPRWPPRSQARRGARQSQRRQGGRHAGRRPARLRALYFTRATAPAGEGPLYHHIGLYAYPPRRARALRRAAAVAAGAAREARTVARAGSRHAHRRGDRRRRAARRRYAGGFGTGARHAIGAGHEASARRSHSRASRAPIPISPAAQAYPGLRAAALPDLRGRLRRGAQRPRRRSP